MTARLDTPEGKALYKRRSAMIEPVFAQLFARLGHDLNYRDTQVGLELHLWAASRNLARLTQVGVDLGGGALRRAGQQRAARRELAEETGWGDVVLVGEIHRDVRMVEHGGRIVRQLECLFLARTDPACRELGTSRRYTPVMASPHGDGGRWLNWTPLQRLSGPPGWPD